MSVYGKPIGSRNARLEPEPERAGKSKQCESGHHYSRCMSKYCTCECHKSGR